MKYSVITFGCRVNQADSLAIEGEFRARGAEASPPSEADVLVVNTCSVTASADQGARQTIRRIVRHNPAVRVVVTGCYATRAAADVATLPNVARVIPNADKDQLVEVIAAECGLSTARRYGDADGPCGALIPGVAGRTAFTLRVQTGCDQECSYCIIPSTRGGGRSRPLRQVMLDIERAVSAGYREIALTGVHLGSYGRDLPQRSSLSELVAQIAEWPADVLFRLSSLEPMDCTPAIVDLAASSRRIAPHFHLPLQHGSDDMLRAMRRPYAAADYVRLVGDLHQRIPHASIGSDIIIGFPGETDVEFRDLCEVLERLPLTHLHVFPYCDRPGTEASTRFPKVDGSAIRERARQVRAIGEEMTRRFRAAQAGSVRRALVVDDGWAAVTDNYVKVRLDARHARNTWVMATLPNQ